MNTAARRMRPSSVMTALDMGISCLELVLTEGVARGKTRNRDCLFNINDQPTGVRSEKTISLIDGKDSHKTADSAHDADAVEYR